MPFSHIRKFELRTGALPSNTHMQHTNVKLALIFKNSWCFCGLKIQKGNMSIQLKLTHGLNQEPDELIT